VSAERLRPGSSPRHLSRRRTSRLPY